MAPTLSTTTEEKAPCEPCRGNGTRWTRRDNRNVETSCVDCGGEGEL